MNNGSVQVGGGASVYLVSLIRFTAGNVERMKSRRGTRVWLLLAVLGVSIQLSQSALLILYM